MSSFIETSSLEFIPLDNCSSYKPMGIQQNVFELNNKYFYIKF